MFQIVSILSTGAQTSRHYSSWWDGYKSTMDRSRCPRKVLTEFELQRIGATVPSNFFITSSATKPWLSVWMISMISLMNNLANTISTLPAWLQPPTLNILNNSQITAGKTSPCLTVYRSNDSAAVAGDPVIFTSCNTRGYRHQQWRIQIMCSGFDDIGERSVTLVPWLLFQILYRCQVYHGSGIWMLLSTLLLHMLRICPCTVHPPTWLHRY